jgi:hypothetical protein
MTTTVPCRWEFGGVTYEVDAPCFSSDGVDDLVPGEDVERAEHACVYAALCDGIDDPVTLSFARRSIGIEKAMMAGRLDLPVDAFLDIENNRENIVRASYVYLLRKLVKLSDRGGFVVRRVGSTASP